MRTIIRWTTAIAAVGFILGSAVAMAAPLEPWPGSVDYTAAPHGVPTGDVVPAFDTYDLATGVALWQGGEDALANGGSFTGFYQGDVAFHEVVATGPPGRVVASHLAAGDYEITYTAQLNQRVTGQTTVNGSTLFTLLVDSGQVTFHLDGTPDHSFLGDSGFDDGDTILAGPVDGGEGVFSLTPGGGNAFTALSFDFTLDVHDPDIFDPDSLAHAVMNLYVGVPPTLNFGDGGPDILSVLHQPIDDNHDLLWGTTGQTGFQAVPEPLSLLLVGSAAAGLVILRRHGNRESA